MDETVKQIDKLSQELADSEQQVRQLRRELNAIGDLAYRAGAGDLDSARAALVAVHHLAKELAGPERS